jgi:hypothetical protein
MPPTLFTPAVLGTIANLWANGFRARGIAKKLGPAGIRVTRKEVEQALAHIMSGVRPRAATPEEIALVNANLWLISQGRWGTKPTEGTPEGIPGVASGR